VTAERSLAAALRLHAEGRITEAVALARRIVEAEPAFAPAWSYLGKTLVTRLLRFDEGLAALERAAALAPEDAGVLYDLGWAYEFVAYRLERGGGRPARDPVELYELAAEALGRAIDRETDAGMRDDAEKLREAVLRRLEAVR
jgi:tetratricopeptide (TPR) repeat protein